MTAFGNELTRAGFSKSGNGIYTGDFAGYSRCKVTPIGNNPVNGVRVDFPVITDWDNLEKSLEQLPHLNGLNRINFHLPSLDNRISSLTSSSGIPANPFSIASLLNSSNAALPFEMVSSLDGASKIKGIRRFLTTVRAKIL